jgi:hypothetical protein
VGGTDGERLKDEQVERPLKDFALERLSAGLRHI